MQSIYLDHNATTPLLPEVQEALAACAREAFANPASQHEAGRTARRRLEGARETIARLLGAETSGMRADRVILTSGGTEANNLALFGWAPPRAGRLLISALEHPSVVGPAEELAARGLRVERVRALADGTVDLGHLAELLCREGTQEEAAPAPCLVSTMLGNNETGVLQPVAEIARLAHSHGALVHTDAVQAAGKIEVNFRALGVDAMSVAAHKFHGPRGIGALLLRPGIKLAPLLFGGFQQEGLRPGTEIPYLAEGMAAALAAWEREKAERAERIGSLRQRFEQALRAALESVQINGAAANRLPQTSNVAFLGLDRQALVMALDLVGVACSTGSACASGSSEPSPALLAMGCSKEVVSSSLRFSLGAGTTAAEIDEAVERIVGVVNNLRRAK